MAKLGNDDIYSFHCLLKKYIYYFRVFFTAKFFYF
jgi:hypothetical protein